MFIIIIDIDKWQNTTKRSKYFKLLYTDLNHMEHERRDSNNGWNFPESLQMIWPTIENGWDETQNLWLGTVVDVQENVKRRFLKQCSEKISINIFFLQFKKIYLRKRNLSSNAQKNKSAIIDGAILRGSFY